MGQQQVSLATLEGQPFTEILNSWVVNNDLDSANQLRSIVYYHLKGTVKNQIADKAQKSCSQNLIDQLPNTTSLLHEVLASLTPPKEIFDNQEQFLVSLASIVRWMLLDDLKAKSAQKRTKYEPRITEFLSIPEAPESFLTFDRALSKLELLLPRSYTVALMHYFLGHDIEQITTALNIEKSTVYNELSTAKAYLRTQCQT
jgi:RNA polymerase sigma factor (TIGR02999 family)